MKYWRNFVCEKAIFVQLIDGEPNEILRDLAGAVRLELRYDVPDSGFAVTTFPNKSGGAIQTVCLICFEIVNQNFVGHFLNYETRLASHGIPRTMRIIHFYTSKKE
jgi:hypothetical protein